MTVFEDSDDQAGLDNQIVVDLLSFQDPTRVNGIRRSFSWHTLGGSSFQPSLELFEHSLQDLLLVSTGFICVQEIALSLDDGEFLSAGVSLKHIMISKSNFG